MQLSVDQELAVLGLMELLNSWGYSVVNINNRFFVMGKFTPADEATYYSVVEGRDITSKVWEWSTTSTMTPEKVATMQWIEERKKVTREFHKDIIWKKYVSY